MPTLAETGLMDPVLVEAEFEAIVAANWPEGEPTDPSGEQAPPLSPARVAGGPTGRGRDQPLARGDGQPARSAGPTPGAHLPGRQRSPPRPGV